MDEIVSRLIHGLSGKISLELVVTEPDVLTNSAAIFSAQAADVLRTGEAIPVLTSYEFPFVNDQEARRKQSWPTKSRQKRVYELLFNDSYSSLEDLSWEQALGEWGNLPARHLLWPDNAAWVFAVMLRIADDLKERLEFVGNKKFNREKHAKLVSAVFDYYPELSYDHFAPRSSSSAESC